LRRPAHTDSGYDSEPLKHLVDVFERLDRKLTDLLARLSDKVKSNYTVEEFGELAGRAPYTIRTWIKQGRIQARRVQGTGPRGRLLIPREEVERVIGG
jgi:hypothetical protein